MKNLILKYGLLAGAFVSFWMLFNISFLDVDMTYGMIIGYSSMLIAFSLIYVAVKKKRDTVNDGSIRFGEAFKIGFFIALIASTMYVLSWEIKFYGFGTDFLDAHIQKSIEQIRASKLTAAQMETQISETMRFAKMYKEKPLVNIGFTYLEILPLGILVSFIIALILKRKPKNNNPL